MSHIKTVAAFTSGLGYVYQRGCLSFCTQTGTVVNGQIQGIFCCNGTDLCNNITNDLIANSSTSTSTSTTAPTTLTNVNSLQCYVSNITTLGLGNPTYCQSNEKFCYVCLILFKIIALNFIIHLNGIYKRF